MSDIPVLVCTAGAASGKRFQVPEGGLAVGRSADNAVVILDDGVSRFHARLLYDNGQLWMQDAGSRNGVFVNGQRVTGHRALKVGDEIRIAEHVFKVEMMGPETARVSIAEPAPAEASAPDASPSDDGKGGKGGRWWWPFS